MLLIFLTKFLVCRTKQRFLSMVMIILSSEKKLKNTNKILESKIQSKSLLDGVSLQNNFEYLFDSYHSREDTSVSFSFSVPKISDSFGSV